MLRGAQVENLRSLRSWHCACALEQIPNSTAPLGPASVARRRINRFSPLHKVNNIYTHIHANDRWRARGNRIKHPTNTFADGLVLCPLPFDPCPRRWVSHHSASVPEVLFRI